MTTASGWPRLVLRGAFAMIAIGMAVALPCVVAGALAAAFIPAWRASNVSPTDALRLTPVSR